MSSEIKRIVSSDAVFQNTFGYYCKLDVKEADLVSGEWFPI